MPDFPNDSGIEQVYDFSEEVYFPVLLMSQQKSGQMSSVDLQALFSFEGHTHDDRYPLLSHDHAGVYASVSHDHASQYAEVDHTHEGGSSGSVFPVGMVILFSQSAMLNSDGGWCYCDGRALSRSSYAELFGVIGTLHGDGDGSTTFNVPDLRSRVPMGESVLDGFHAGDTGGEAEHVLTVDEMPSHAHWQLCRWSGSGSERLLADDASASGQRWLNKGGYSGGDSPHNNLPPYMVFSFFIRVSNP